MRVIHFTHGATDPLWNSANGARCVPLADGFGTTHVACLHLEPGAKISEAPASAAAALLLVHGYGVLWTYRPYECRLDVSPGMGFVFEAGSRYSLRSRTGMIYLLVESTTLEATAAGISTPARIRGQLWPGETTADLTPPPSFLGRCIGDFEWPVRRFARSVLWRLSSRRKRQVQVSEWEWPPLTWRTSATGVGRGNYRSSGARCPEGPGDSPIRASSSGEIEP